MFSRLRTRRWRDCYHGGLCNGEAGTKSGWNSAVKVFLKNLAQDAEFADSFLFTQRANSDYDVAPNSRGSLRRESARWLELVEEFCDGVPIAAPRSLRQ